MSLPLEPRLSTQRGRYSLSSGRKASGLPDHSIRKMAVRDEETIETQASGGKVQRQINRFRAFLGRSCCSCVEKMPSIVLVISICLLVAILLALIPAIFLLTNAVASESQAHVSEGRELPSLRSGFSFPSQEDSEEPDESLVDENIMHGIPLSSLLPTNVSICQGFGFACTNQPHIVISTNRRCDGLSDCPDGSDEANCVDCQTAFSCALHPNVSTSDMSICLRPKHLCDGVKHCPDGSDEEQYCKDSCASGELSCPSRHGSTLCLPEIAICDGIEDCGDGQDEKNCTSCGRGAKFCESSHTCLAARFLCDGTVQCADGTDEQDCDCRSCSGSSMALCDDGTCIDRWRVCDGRKDCSNGMDEEDCPGHCLVEKEMKEERMITCSDDRKYLESEACSGDLEQCELDCDKCDTRKAFQCAVNGKCIPKAKLCDSVPDCEDGEDEKDCECDAESGNFKCLSSSKCISESLRCDGVLDCADASDEADCETCPDDSIRCDFDSSCRPASARCDGVPDCKDGSDETNCTCYECTALHSWTYKCEESDRCFRRDEVCSPYSLCPNATLGDKVFCAGLALKLHLF